MSIAPPSDIILDVANAADPARMKVAAERLARIANEKAAPEFAGIMKAESARPAHRPVLPPPTNWIAAAPAPKTDSPYRKFEAMVLGSFIESALPKNADSFFGGGTAGDVWRGMLAQQIGGQLARAGGIGIARQIEAAHHADKPAIPGDSS